MSKLNPQKATAYVGPGVLRKGGKITPVPNGPLIKKKGIYAGSTLKAGGKIKKAQNGEYVTQEGKNYTATKKVKTKNGPRYYQAKSPNLSFAREVASFKERANPSDSIPKARLSPRALEIMNKKNGGMLKRADGSYSKRGLWDNLRSKAAQNKKTGAKPKAPTRAMLTQEKKIKAKK